MYLLHAIALEMFKNLQPTNNSDLDHQVHHFNTQIVLTLTIGSTISKQIFLTLTTRDHHHKPKMIVLILATRNNHQIYIKIQYMFQSKKYPGTIYLALLKSQNIPQMMRENQLKHPFKKYPAMQSQEFQMRILVHPKTLKEYFKHSTQIWLRNSITPIGYRNKSRTPN